MSGSIGEWVFGLEEGVTDQLAGVLIRETVERAGAILPSSDDPGETKLGEMLGDGCGGLIDDVSEVVDGQFAVKEGQNDTNPGGVRKHAEDLYRELDVGICRVLIQRLRVCIHMQIMSRSKVH